MSSHSCWHTGLPDINLNYAIPQNWVSLISTFHSLVQVLLRLETANVGWCWLEYRMGVAGHSEGCDQREIVYGVIQHTLCYLWKIIEVDQFIMAEILVCTTLHFGSAAQLDQLCAGGMLVRVSYRCWSGHKLCLKINCWSLCGNWWWYCLVYHHWRSWVPQASLFVLGSDALSAGEVGNNFSQAVDNWQDSSMFQSHWP